MNWFENVIYMLQIEMEEPKPWGWFHLMWIFLVVISLIILFCLRNKHSEKQLKIVLGTYGIVALGFELIKQLIWSFNYDSITGLVTWDYQWYAAPFQLCTTPIFASIICLFLKENKFRNALLSYMAYVTILGSFMTMIIPDSCFVSDTLINIHTMWLHCGSFVVSIYLLMSRTVKINKQNLKSAIKVFLIFVLLAEIINISIYNLGILGEETFNMFYISPYFISTLPVFNVIQENVLFIIYLLIYIIAISLGATIVYCIAYFIKNLKYKKRNMQTIDNKMENKKEENKQWIN